MKYTHKVRVRYAECDQMGFLHHSIYALYLEEARTEQMRSKGITYKEMEESGLIMPVRTMNIEFKKAARYDDLLSIEVWIPEKPVIRCVFNYRILNQHDELLGTASMEMFYARKSDLRPVKVPQIIIDKYNF
ncbi:MAG: Acyl-CoA thioester hydrolase YbgC [Bacteroidota bacterium]|jgi:acyl-CoA thioester hydrolase|nr:thioesterase family protein [Bacteroidia bacterium]